MLVISKRNLQWVKSVVCGYYSAQLCLRQGVIQQREYNVTDAICGKGNGLKTVVFADGRRRERGSQSTPRSVALTRGTFRNTAQYNEEKEKSVIISSLWCGGGGCFFHSDVLPPMDASIRRCFRRIAFVSHLIYFTEFLQFSFNQL